MRVVRSADALHVSGAVTVTFVARAVDDVAFGVTAQITAINDGTVGPSGLSRQLAERGHVAWTTFMRRRRGPMP